MTFFFDRFHPAVQRAKAILDSGELGAVKHIEARMSSFRGFMKDDDIRFDYDLGGGAMMDMGCKLFSNRRVQSLSSDFQVIR